MICEPHSKEDLEQIIESMSDGLVGVDRDGTILFSNRALTQSLGWSEHDLTGAHFERFFHAFPRTSACVAANARRKDGTQTQIIISRLNDHLFLIRDLESESYSGRWWQLISDAVAGKTGEEFFSSLVIQLTRALAVDLALSRRSRRRLCGPRQWPSASTARSSKTFAIASRTPHAKTWPVAISAIPRCGSR